MIAERFHFNQRIQSGGESVSEYVAELKRLATNCDFGQRLEEALRDRLVCGLRNSNVQRKLLTEPGLTYAKAVEIALGMEAAEKNTRQLKGNDAAIQRVLQHSARQDPGTTSRHSKGSASKVSGAMESPQSAPCHRCG